MVLIDDLKAPGSPAQLIFDQYWLPADPKQRAMMQHELAYRLLFRKFLKATL